jgi:uncharacterized protein (DUF58 family)
MLNATLVPGAVDARAKPFGRLPFGFGPRFFVALLLGLVWMVPAWWSPRFLVFPLLWNVAVFAVWLADLLRLPAASSLDTRRYWRHALSLSHAGAAGLQVRNGGRVSVQVSLVDETPFALRTEPPSASVIVPAGGEAAVEYSVLPRERGDVRLGRLYLRYQTLLGFAERWAVAELSQTVRIMPDIEQARRHALYLIRSRQVEMEKRRKRQRGAGREFQALREYREGDDQRDVCWPATARRHQLITRTYQAERSQTVWIVIDAGRLLRAEVQDANRAFLSTKLDYAVDAALSLAQVALQSGDRTGLIAYGRSIQQLVGLGRGPLQIRALLDSLAMVKAEGAEANHALAARALLRTQSRRSLIVWITDFAETPTAPEVIEYASQLTQRHLVVFAALTQPDLLALARAVPENEDDMFRHAAALEIAQRREAMLRGLRQRGVLAVDVAPGLLAGGLVNQYLEIKDRGML